MNVQKAMLSMLALVGMICIASCSNTEKDFTGVWRSVQSRNSTRKYFSIVYKEDRYFLHIERWDFYNESPNFDNQDFPLDYDKEHNKLTVRFNEQRTCDFVYLPSKHHLLVTDQSEFERMP